MVKPRLYPTNADGHPLLTNWSNNHQLDEYAATPRPTKEASKCPA